MARTGKAKATVWRWRRRFAEAGVEGFLCDATRPRGKAPIPTEKVAEVVRLTRATHWTARAMARAAGLGVATVQRNRAAHGLAPHRRRVFKLSRDPALVEKLADIAGLYVSPPAHAVVFSADEKSHIQALDRTRPGLPLKKGRDAAQTVVDGSDNYVPPETLRAMRKVLAEAPNFDASEPNYPVEILRMRTLHFVVAHTVKGPDDKAPPKLRMAGLAMVDALTSKRAAAPRISHETEISPRA